MGTNASSGRQTGARAAEVRAGLDALRRIVQGIRLASTRAERATGLSGAQLFVLQQLAEEPTQSLNELAIRTRTHQSSVSIVVTRLVARRLVSRRHAAADGRRLLLELTPTGRNLLADAPETAQSRIMAALEGMSQRRRATLVNGLATLVNALDMAAAAPVMLLEPAEEPKWNRRHR
jgi:DNA-binding MarR family transcriptional regulator